MTDTHKPEIDTYQTLNGKEPFTEWLASIRDNKTRGRIGKRMDRVEDGNIGRRRHLMTNIYELILNFGPGYRIYFSVYSSKSDSKTILILCAGDKSSQTRDIKRAEDYSLDAEQRIYNKQKGYNHGTL